MNIKIIYILLALFTASSFISCTPESIQSEPQERFATGDEVDDPAEPDEDK